MPDKDYPLICKYTLSPDEEKTFNAFSGFILVYIKSGSGTFRLNEKKIEFCHGTTVIMSCLDYLIKEKGGTLVELTVVMFSEQVFAGRISEFFTIRSLPLYTVFDEADFNKPETILDLISSESDRTTKNNDIFMRNLSKELLIYAIKNAEKNNALPVYDIKTELSILYIYSHFRESISIERVAAHVHYSVNYFYHSFQKNTGTTFQKFLHNLRLDYSVTLLRITNLTVSDICYECGYGSVQYFSTAFRKRFGKSPKNYINETNIKEQHK